MTARIFPFPRAKELDTLLPSVPSIPVCIITLRRHYWKKLNANERMIVAKYESLAMAGCDSPAHLAYLHTLLVRCERTTLLSYIRAWSRRMME